MLLASGRRRSATIKSSVYGRIDHDRIREARLARELAQSGEAVILMYFSTLSKMEREDLMRSTWKDGSSVPILDETLFDVLTQIYGDRFRNFLEASLPYTATNPYNPETDFGLRVAPEMFYGREQLADDIEAITGGTSILFGGRQLGKTVLTPTCRGEISSAGIEKLCLVRRSQGRRVRSEVRKRSS